MFGLLSYVSFRSVFLPSSTLISIFLFSVFLSFIPFQHTRAADKKYTIKARADDGGSISPSGDIRVEKGDNQTFAITADPDYAIKDVIVDGNSAGAVSTYTFENVRSNHEIRATFYSTTVTITAEADKGGDIDPSGKVEVDIGSDQTFTMLPDEGRMVKEVKVDDINVGAVSSYTFYNVTEEHKIQVSFTKAFTITPLAGEHGSIEPSDPTVVPEHADLTCTIIPDPGYVVEDVLVDMKSVGPVSSYLFKDIKEDHYIEALFRANLAIQEVTIPNFPMKVGDVITATITAANDAGETYTLVSGSVGGYPLSGLQRISPTSFEASMTIVEGGQNYLASQSIPVSDLIISSGQLQSMAYNSSITQGNDPIDARSPVVTKLEVPSLAVGPGGRVDVTLMADGTGYEAGTGTRINGIPVDSDRVTFTERTSWVYVLSYVVSEEDQEVAPGGLEVTVVLVDPAGNPGNPYSVLEPNELEIYTALPRAVLAGPPEICEGEEVNLDIQLEGRPPWELILDDGTSSTTYSGISSSETSIVVIPTGTTTYKINKVTDINGVENVGSGEVEVTVHRRTEVNIINLSAGYALDSEPVTLEADVAGGVFSGPGVISATATFYPEVAGMTDLPHTIVYTYENEYGCISEDTREVHVLGGEEAFLIPDTVVCSNDDPFTVTVLNLAGNTGTFRLLDSGGGLVPGMEDQGDNSATIDPEILEPGIYEVEFQYDGLDELILRRSFRLESVSLPDILNADLEAICQNSEPLRLQSNLEKVVFEGDGVTWDSEEGFYFNPGEAGAGTISISCTFISGSGCKATSLKEIEILPAPKVNFGMSSACIPDGGELVTFMNLTAGMEEVESWLWDFGDPTSGKENQSSLMEPSHFYQETGQKRITLTATTAGGCSDTYSMDSNIDSKPVADFELISDCLPVGTGVKVINRSLVGSTSIDTLIWRINSEEGSLLEELGTGPMKDTVNLPFPESGKFNIELYAASRGGCYDEISREIQLRPTLQLEKAGYEEAFNGSDGGWTVHSEDQKESWVWGVPDFTGYGQEAGNFAWYTQLPSGQQGYMENSWVMSPCFDLSHLERPLIRMDIMRSFVPVLNGAVIQYRDVLDEGWKTVGADSPGIAWYNSSDIIHKPGGSSTGWGMEEFDPDGDWVGVAHDLEQVAGSPHVTFRVALATNGKEPMGNQGFAFDNLKIGERSKLAVLEHFTDNSDNNSRIADEIIDAVGKEFRRDVIDLQYHMSYYAFDPLYANNPEPTTARIFHYGVPSIPYAVLDGGSLSENRYLLSEMGARSMGEQILLLTLEEPSFDLELAVEWKETGLEARTTVTCNEDRYNNAVQLYLTVIETSVTAYAGANGDVQFRNVVLDMLPTPAGKLLDDQWVKGQSETMTAPWVYQPYVEDVNELAVVAFLQDRSTNQVLQAAVQYKDMTVNVPPRLLRENEFRVYPNPAGQLLYVSLGDGLQVRSRLELIDLGGKVALAVDVPPGTRIQQMDLLPLNKGIFLVRWVKQDALLGVSKLVITR